MNRRGRIRYLLASSNTGQGYRSFLPALIESLKKVYVLKGAPGSGRTTFIRQIGLELAAKGYQADFFVSFAGSSSLEGVMCPQLGLAVVKGDCGYPSEHEQRGISCEVIDFSEFWDGASLAGCEEEIAELAEEIEKQLRSAAELLMKAARVKEKISAHGSGYPDPEEVERLVTRLVTEILEQSSRERHYFGTALSIQGLVSYVDGLSASCAGRYVLKGFPGKVKSAVLTAVGRMALARGHQVEFYHDGFNPENLNMIIITGLGVAVIDGDGLGLTVRPGDIILDARDWNDSNQETASGTDVVETQRRLDTLLEEAHTALLQAESIRKRLRGIFSRAMDFREVERVRSRIMEDIDAGFGHRPQISTD